MTYITTMRVMADVSPPALKDGAPTTTKQVVEAGNPPADRACEQTHNVALRAAINAAEARFSDASLWLGTSRGMSGLE